MTSATSSPVPRRPAGWSATRPARAASSMFFSSGVSMKPGPTALMRTPCVAYSMAAVLVRPTTPCFAEE